MADERRALPCILLLLLLRSSHTPATQHVTYAWLRSTPHTPAAPAAQELLRDQLTQKENVAPVLRRLDVSLIQLALGLALTLGAGEAVTVVEGENGPATLKTLTGDDATRFTNRLRSDEDFAAREQERGLRRMQEDGSGVKPGYCDSRYYKILAGGNGQGGVGCS